MNKEPTEKTENKINKIIRLLKETGYEEGIVSPNEVNLFAHSMGVTDLTSDEVVYISNNY